MSADKIYDALFDAYLLLTGQAFNDKKTPYEILQETINDLSGVLENYENLLHEALSNLTDREVGKVETMDDGDMCPFCLTTVVNGNCLCPEYCGDDFLQRS